MKAKLDSLSLLLFQNRVAIALLLVQKFRITQFFSQTLRFPLPLTNDLALLFNFFVGVVQFLLQLFLDGHHLLQIVFVLLLQALLTELEFAEHSLILLLENVRVAVVFLVVRRHRRYLAIQARRTSEKHFHFQFLILTAQLATLALQESIIKIHLKASSINRNAQRGRKHAILQHSQ